MRAESAYWGTPAAPRGALSRLSMLPLMTQQTQRRLFDHLVGAKQDRCRYGKTERLGGLEVEDHLVFRRQLHREIARLLAA